MRSVLDVPLVRVNEANSPDLQSISEFWSSELVRFVQRVTECIPHSMFKKLDNIFALQTHKLRELPTKLERTKLRDYVFNQDRQDLAKVTYSIAMLTEGMLRIETTQLGVEVIEPSVLLEMGVRKQLVKRMTRVLQRSLAFDLKAAKGSTAANFFGVSSKGAGAKPFEEKLVQTSRHLQGIRRSLEYIQDYMQVHGLAVWQEEMCKLVWLMTERELRTRGGGKALASRQGAGHGASSAANKSFSTEKEEKFDYLLEAIEFEMELSGGGKSSPSVAQTFLGSCCDELIHLTSPFETIYSFSLCGWFDAATGKEEVGLNTFELIREALAVCGTHGLDQILQLETFNSIRVISLHLNKMLANFFRDEISHLRQLMVAKDGKWADEFARVVAGVTKSKQVKHIYRRYLPLIGQCQLIRRHVAIELSNRAKLESATYIRSLQCLNQSLIRHEKQQQQQHRQQEGGESAAGAENVDNISVESKLLEKVARHLEYSGLHDPLLKVYHTFIENRDDDSMPLTLLILSCDFLEDYVYQRQNNCISIVPVKKNKNTPDFTVTTVGFLTLLRQLPLPMRLEFLDLLQLLYKHKLRLSCQQGQLAVGTKAGNEVLVMNQFVRLLVQLLGVEGYALPKLLDDASMDIDIELVA